MSNSEEGDDVERELAAIATIYSVLKPLSAESQSKILRYLVERIGIEPMATKPMFVPAAPQSPSERMTPAAHFEPEPIDERGDGISPIAHKWMKRSGLTTEMLSPYFSLGLSEIDLIANGVPGSTKKEKFKSVLLLKGIASYLGSGAARVTFEDLKQVASHYDVYDPPNFAANMKSFSKEVNGSKEAGFTLTASGLTEAAELICEMIKAPPKRKK